MAQTAILVLCRHPEIQATIIRLINNNAEWTATGFAEPADALNDLKNKPYGLVLLGSGFDETEENELILALQHIRKGIPIVKHYGGGSGLLSAEIYQGLGPLIA